MPEDTQMTNEEIREMLVTAPVWDSIVWDAIQEGDYALVESRFADLLKGELERDEWSKVYWDGILSGIPSFRGDVEILSWSTSVLPALARAILKTATPKNLEVIYRSLSLERARSLHALLIASVPGNDLLKKKVWLQEQNLNLLKFFNTNTAGLSFEAPNENLLSRQGFARAQVLPENLLSTLFSAEVAGKISELGGDNKLTEEQTRNVAVVCGSVVLGLTKMADLLKIVKEKCHTEESLSVIIQKSLEEKILSPLKKDIDASAPPNPFAVGENTSATEGGGVNIKPEVLPTSPRIPEEGKKNPIFSPLPATNSSAIPQTLTQKASEPFFKKWTGEENTNQPKEKEPPVGPKIIQEEMRAQSLSAAPKLGFRVSNDKLGEVQEKAAPLRAAELTMSNSSGEAEPLASSSPRETGQKLGTPISPLGAKLSMGGEGFPKTAGSSSGFLGKIRNTLSLNNTKPSEVASQISELKVPLPPPEATSPISKMETKPNEPVKIAVAVPEKEKGFMPSQAIPLSPVEKEPAPVTLATLEVKKETLQEAPLITAPKETPPPPPSKISPSPTPFKNPTVSESALQPKTSSVMPRIDLRKMSDITIEKVPAPKPERQPGFFSRLFKKESAGQKIIVSPEIEKKPTLSPTATNTPREVVPQEHPNAPLPPPPPAPLKTPELPKSIGESAARPLPVQKVSPLTSFQKKPEGQPPPQNPAKVVETVSSTPRVVNYSEYPLRDNPLKQSN